VEPASVRQGARGDEFVKLYAIAVVLGALACIAAGCGETFTGPAANRYFVFSFEGSLEGWTKSGLDLDNPPVEWEISLSLDRARDGTSSVRFFVNNINDKSKIYVERAFAVDTSANYRVGVRYYLATSDWGQVNLWTLIAGATSHPVASASDLTFQGSTGNGYNSEVGPVWIYRAYEFDVKSSEAGKIYVQIGVRGDSEYARIYYLDAVHVSFTRK
jgi:hypothetical protein